MVAIIIIIAIVAGVSVAGTAGYFLVVGDNDPFDALSNIYGEPDPLEVPFVTEEELDQGLMELMEQNPDVTHNDTFPDIPEDEIIQTEEEIMEQAEMDADLDNPITSDDPPIEQLCDELNLFCGTDGLNLKIEIAKIDANGTRFVEEVTQQFTPLAFIGDPSTGIDFSSGSLEIRMWVQTFPDTPISGSGVFNFDIENAVSVGLTTLLVTGIGDQDGFVTVDFIDQTGQRSQVFDFSFTDNQGLFPTDTSTKITGSVSNFVVQRELRDEFEIVDSEIFSMDILNSLDAITVVNLEGGTDILLPADDQLTITATAITERCSCCGGASYACGINSPEMGSVLVTDKQGQAICQNDAIPQGAIFFNSARRIYVISPSVIACDVSISRNSEYRIQIGEPTPFDFTLVTPVSQKNYDLGCRTYSEATIYANDPASYTRLGIGYGQIDVNTVPIFCNLPLGTNGTIFPNPNDPSGGSP